MKIEGPTNPFHIARAYRISPQPRAQSASAPAFVAPAQASQPQPASTSRLVAAAIPGRVEFSSDAPRPSDAASIPMYRHPADRNAAATAVTAGRTIDIQG
ncbi:MAG: hypothetical protein JNK58_03680 [Phycisphaerae bacterium]|nr:hypothetical protein [Phycisphaerae bacterium]